MAAPVPVTIDVPAPDAVTGAIVAAPVPVIGPVIVPEPDAVVAAVVAAPEPVTSEAPEPDAVTAEIVAAPHDVPVFADPGLREIDVGSWSGLTHAELEERFPDGERPDGETREQHLARVLATVERIARTHPGERLLLVTHGGSMRALRSHASDEPFHPIANCGVIELHFRDDRLTTSIG